MNQAIVSTSIKQKINSKNKMFKKNKRMILSGLAKKMLFRQLKKLHAGSLVLIESGIRYEFGEGSSKDHGELSTDLYAEMHIHDASCYADILSGGSIGAAEAFITGDWSSPDLSKVMRVLVRNMDILDQMEGGLASLSKPLLKWVHMLNENSEKGSRRNIAAHYDLGNEFFQLFLDPTMMYSAGIFPADSATMQEASEYKLKCICEKLQLSSEDRVVEVGTGWGGFAIYAAKNYGCHITTTTISEQQYSMAKQRVEAAGLSDKITLLKQDYRELDGKFDKLVSIEMIEAVGWEYYETFFKTCSSLLKDNGVMLIQAITIEDQRYETAKRDVDFIKQFIFPGSCIPSINALSTASMKASDMRMIHLSDFAQHYARTLNNWAVKLGENLEEIYQLGYSEDFIRMWRFYLSYCEGGFAERAIGVSHLVFAKPLHREEALRNAAS
ncbi:MAG: cyclopropane-fatty-acyl-phospholipid synthase [Pseudohongiellaceae bacterium]|jgi:cyclopropane-fatty-acyl-phospholipid synthase